MDVLGHTHEFVLIAIRADGTRIYGCVGCQKTKTVLTTDALNAMLKTRPDD